MWRLGPTIVHVHTLKAGLLGMVAATMARVPVRVFHVHGLPHLAARGLKYRLLVWATKIACMLAHRVLCVSPSLREVLIDQKLCPKAKVVVPANGSCDGIDASNRFNPARVGGFSTNVRRKYKVPDNAFVVAFIGRLVHHKGLAELGEAWTSLRSEHPDLHLLIVGDFEPQDPVPPSTIKIFAGDPRARMTGLCVNMPELYSAIDLVVLPSHYEGFPTVLLEAAAMSLPVVATAIPGNVDAVRDNVTGVLFPSHNASALAGAIERYIRDPALRRKHGVTARQRVLRDFRPEPIREFIYREYGALLTSRGLSSPGDLSDCKTSASKAKLAAADRY